MLLTVERVVHILAVTDVLLHVEDVAAVTMIVVVDVVAAVAMIRVI